MNSIINKGVRAINQQDLHKIIIDDKLYLVNEDSYEQLMGTLSVSGSPEDVRVRVFRHRQWSDSEVAMLGDMKDEAVAKELGISVSSVSIKRRELSIPYLKLDKSRERFWLDCELKLLGAMSDRELAKQLDISTTTVGNKRRELGVKSFDRPKRDWSEDQVKLLGTMPDREVAELLDLPYHTVYEKRRRLDVAAVSRRRFEEEVPQKAPRLSSDEKDIADRIYSIYDSSPSLVDAVASIKLYADRLEAVDLSKVAQYLIAKNSDNFPLERCLSLVGLIK